MDRLARPKDDLFDNSTMTFGEHLEELRGSLVKAILWLAGGMLIGLYFADHVIQFVQTPLRAAIQEFNADRDLYRLGYTDPTAAEVQPLRQFLTTQLPRRHAQTRAMQPEMILSGLFATIDSDLDVDLRRIRKRSG